MDGRTDAPVGWQRPRLQVPVLDVAGLRAHGERGYEEAERFVYVRGISDSDLPRMAAAEGRYHPELFSKLIDICVLHPTLILPEHKEILADLQRQLPEAEAIRHREKTNQELGRFIGLTRLVRSASVVELAENLVDQIISVVERERDGLSPSLRALAVSVEFRDLMERAKANRQRTKDARVAARDESKDLIEKLTNEVGQLRAALEQSQRDQADLRHMLLQNGLQPPVAPSPAAPSTRRATERK